MLPKFIPLLFLICLACKQKNISSIIEIENIMQTAIAENPYKTIADIPLPAGYIRINYDAGTFAAWLRKVSLKKDKTVYTYEGSQKYNQTAQFAVLDVSVGKQNLQQCADAVMRLRAEYFYDMKSFNKIRFTDNDGTSYNFQSPFTRTHFDNFLQQVFGMCGSASLQKQLKQHVEMKDIEPGDVLIRGGFPGHAVIVMDVAFNNAGKKIYMLAQSYMPAQDIHVLVNPVNKLLSPWYEVNDETKIKTPEYDFTMYELKRW